MPTFRVTDPTSGRTLKLTGDSPPTEQELNAVFGSMGGPAPSGPMPAAAASLEKPGYMARLGKDFDTRIGKAGAIQGNQNMTGMEKRIGYAGQGLGMAADVVNEGLSSAYHLLPESVQGGLSKVGNAILDSRPILDSRSIDDKSVVPSLREKLGGAAKEYERFSKENPRAANIVNVAGNAANLAGGLSMVKPAVGAAKLVPPAAKEAALIGVDAARMTGRGAKSIVKKALPTPEGLLESGAKWSTTLSPEARKRVTGTMLKEKIPLNPEGYDKLETALTDVNNQIRDALKPHNDTPIDAQAVVSRASEARKKADGSYDRKAQVAKVDEEVSGFIDNWGDRLTVRDAQAIKQDIYKQLKSHYDSVAKGGLGKYTDGEIAAKKNIAKGLKEEIEKVAHDAPIKELNARESNLLNLEPHLRRAVGRVGNHNILSLDDVLAAGVGATVGGPAGAAFGIAKKTLGSPSLKSKMAIGLDAMQGGPQIPAKLLSKTGQALQAELSAGPSLRGYLSPGNERLPVTPFPGGPDAGITKNLPGPVRSGVTLGEPYGPAPATLINRKQLPPGQGFELMDADFVDAPYTSRTLPAPRLEAPQQASAPMAIGLDRTRGEGFVFKDAPALPDLLKKDGTPYMNEAGARYAIKAAGVNGYEVVPVEGGWVARAKQQPMGKEIRTPNAPPPPPDPLAAQRKIVAALQTHLDRNTAMKGTPVYRQWEAALEAERAKLPGGEGPAPIQPPAETAPIVPPKTEILPGETIPRQPLPEIAAPKPAAGAQNLVTYIQQGGGINLGKEYNASIARQWPDLKRVVNDGGRSPDDWAAALNGEGFNVGTGDDLVELLKTEQGRKTFTPEHQERMLNAEIRRMEHGHIETALADLESRQIDTGAVQDSRREIGPHILGADEAKGLSYSEKTALEELDDFFTSVTPKSKKAEIKKDSQPERKGEEAILIHPRDAKGRK